MGTFWLVVVTDVMSEADWGELGDLSDRMGAPWDERIVAHSRLDQAHPLFPGSSHSTIYTVHPEARP
ncbi:hypothetical protein [Streptomyces uncialis]|uniref:hypothetical protein n=1 Tax=Streptomyces uncialis TaxID=1048205 RepID=UPI0011610802|nr:hypothetical protein [Streptomyces uncialis]